MAGLKGGGRSLAAGPWGRFLDASRRREWWPGLMLATVLVTSVIIVVLLAVVIWLSFFQGMPGDENIRYNFANYVEVFSESQTYEVLLNTFYFSFVTLVVALVFGIPGAWLVERTDFRGKTLIYTLMTIGLLIPGFASAMGWLFLLHPRIGLFNQWIMAMFGLAEAPISILTLTGMGWVLGLNLAPLAFIMTAAVFRAMDPALEEAAQMAGANFRQTMWRITLRLAWPGILAASLYIFTIGFAAFDVPAIIGWGARIFTFSTYLLILLNPEEVVPRYGAVAALSAFIIVLAGLMSWWYSTMQGRSRQYEVVTGKGYRPNIILLGRAMVPAWSYLGLYFVLAKVLPLLVLMWASVLPYFALPSTEAFASITFENYLALPWEQTLGGLKNTAILMVLTPTVTILISLAFSWIVLRSRIPGRSNFDLIAFLPHAVPGIVFGVGALLLTLFVLDAIVPIYGTIWILLIVFVVGRISYATRMTNSGLIQIHHELDESAHMSGAGVGGVLRHILVPLLTPTMLYAWLWIALLTFRELTLAVILTTADNMTLPVVIWSIWTSGGLAEASALALAMLVMMIPIIVLYWSVARKRGLISGS